MRWSLCNVRVCAWLGMGRLQVGMIFFVLNINLNHLSYSKFEKINFMWIWIVLFGLFQHVMGT